MMRIESSGWPFAWTVRSVDMPGLRCSCETITRSAPFTTKAPSDVMTGRSPRNTSSSRTSSPSLSRNVAWSGLEYVCPSLRASDNEYFGSPNL